MGLWMEIKLLKVNGEDLENIIDINKYLFLRDVKEVRVERHNGKIENISIPEDIGTIMFKNGSINAFAPTGSSSSRFNSAELACL